MKAREEFKPFDVTEYLGTAEDRAAYLRAMWEDSSGDPAIVATALGDVARALGMSKLARDTGVARAALYKALSARGNPELGTITKVFAHWGSSSPCGRHCIPANSTHQAYVLLTTTCRRG